MKKTIWFACVVVVVMAFVLGCSGVMKPLLADLGIDRVQVALAGGAPEYGRESKMITDEKEIAGMVGAFDDMKIGDVVPEQELTVSDASEYLFYSGDKLVARYTFNGNDSTRIWSDGDYRYAAYAGDTPYSLYQNSVAQTVHVDGELQPMQGS